MHEIKNGNEVYFEGEKIGEIEQPNRKPLSDNDAMMLLTDAGFDDKQAAAILAVLGGIDA